MGSCAKPLCSSSSFAGLFTRWDKCLDQHWDQSLLATHVWLLLIFAATSIPYPYILMLYYNTIIIFLCLKMFRSYMVIFTVPNKRGYGRSYPVPSPGLRGLVPWPCRSPRCWERTHYHRGPVVLGWGHASTYRGTQLWEASQDLWTLQSWFCLICKLWFLVPVHSHEVGWKHDDQP